MTCYNRREKTLHCLEKVYAQQGLGEEFDLQVFMVDDGSSDGTADAVASRFPEVNIYHGNGSLFWNGGMNLAYGKALEQNLDYYLWLNDDTFLYEDAITRLMETHDWTTVNGKPNSIILGGTCDPRTGEFSYGGFKRVSVWTLKMIPVAPGEEPRECTTNTGNCVLIPKSVADKVGNIEPFYTHRWGDPDYGLRARKKGCSVWVAAGYIGECEDNPTAERWTDQTLSLGERIKDFHSIKGYIKKDWFFYVRRHGGVLWFLLWIKPYVDMVVTSLKYRISGGKTTVPKHA